MHVETYMPILPPHSHHMSAKDKQLLRCDKDGFEKLISNPDFRNMDASRVLAVDYVPNLLLHLQYTNQG